MPNEISLNDICRKAFIPQQLTHYSMLIAPESKARVVGDCLVYFRDDVAIVVGYPIDGNMRDLSPAQIDRTIAELSNRKNLERIVVLAPIRPETAPVWAPSHQSAYWYVSFPYKISEPKSGLDSLFTKPSKEGVKGFMEGLRSRPAKLGMPVNLEKWNDDIEALTQTYLNDKSLNQGSRYMFEKLEEYTVSCPDSRIFTTRKSNGEFDSCIIADFTSENTVFLMMGFGVPKPDPASEDSLMKAFFDAAIKEGKKRANLGMAINSKMDHYKKVWGATPYLNMIETIWEVGESGIAQAKYYEKEMARRATARNKENVLLKLKRWIGI